MKHFSTETIINEIESILADYVIGEKYRKGYGLFFDLEFEDYIVRTDIRVDEKDSLITIAIWPDFSIPEEKVPRIFEMLNYINKRSTVDHAFYKPDLEKIIVTGGILLTKDGLDKFEFEKAIGTLFGNTRLYFSMAKEMLSSDSKPEEVFGRLLRKLHRN